MREEERKREQLVVYGVSLCVRAHRRKSVTSKVRKIKFSKYILKRISIAFPLKSHRVETTIGNLRFNERVINLITSYEYIHGPR